MGATCEFCGRSRYAVRKKLTDVEQFERRLARAKR